MLCSDGALAQAAQRLWGLLLGDLPEPPGCGPGHPALGVPAGAGAGAEGPRGPCQPQPRCVSVHKARIQAGKGNDSNYVASLLCTSMHS